MSGGLGGCVAVHRLELDMHMSGCMCVLAGTALEGRKCATYLLSMEPPSLASLRTELSEPAKKEKGRAPWVQLALLAAAAALAATRVLAKKN